MEFFVSVEDIANEFASNSMELMDLLALLASEDQDQEGSLTEALADAHSCSEAHCAVLPWLSRLIVALGRVESGVAGIDAAGLVS